MAKQHFMKSIKDLNCKATVEKARAFVKTYETHEKAYANGGNFWPLSKWAHDGFDADTIKSLTLPEDIQQHEILGTCYRVKILMKEERGAQGTTGGDEAGYQMKLSELMSTLNKTISGATQAAQEARSAQGIEAQPPSPEDEGSDEESSSSSSSSSSSMGKKSKKKGKKKEKKEKKKSKKEKRKAQKEKARLQLQKQQEKEARSLALQAQRDQQQAKKMIQKEINPHLQKVTRARESLLASTEHPKFADLGSEAFKAETLTLLASLENLKETFKAAHTSGTAVPPNLKSGLKLAEQAQKAGVILQTLFKRPRGDKTE